MGRRHQCDSSRLSSSCASPIYALVDCNNFYASCERLFNPALNGKPVVVLSNNDGCIVARSNEAKALGIPMGAPFYKYRALLKRHQVAVFSSNYTLYGDLSQRVMASLRLLCPEVEVYSIDEAFLRLDSLAHCDLQKYAENMREKIYQWTGIPVSIGIAPTKTLAKLANRVAKSQTTTGVFDLRERQLQQTILQKCEVVDIWGIAHRTAAKLQRLGISTAQQLCDYPPKMIRQHLGVVVERIVLELNGIACLALEKTLPKKNIMASRSFGKPITSFADLAEAISHHTARACIKLRQQNSKAQAIYIFITTNQFRLSEPQYQNGKMLGLSTPTADTSRLIAIAKKGLREIFRPGYQYYKAGIMLMDIASDNIQQDLLLDNDMTNTKREKVMQVMDTLNTQFGTNTLFIAAEGMEPNWSMRIKNKSLHFTTNWQELARVLA
ncbi:MAG TPA: Y-family DNA polymerase [Gammaproteobacteria bacterium]|nr:Y-family DNA polymerase [Gammaproteobacteria bacterium]